MRVFVTTPAQAAARDAAAIAAGTASRDLMLAAGQRAADAVKRVAGDRLRAGVAVFAGTGNNGGDAWIVANILRREGVRVRVHSTGDPASADAQAARAAANASGQLQPPRGEEGVAIDGLLGTGASGAPRGAVLDALAKLRDARNRGALVVALDVPTGLDAATGESHPALVPADLTVTFGTIKRGLLIGRHAAGAIEVVDIGLGAHTELGDGAPLLLDPAEVRGAIPPIRADAHKGTRARLTIVGGAPGMAGAATLAARGALRAGVGLARLCVAPKSLVAVQASVPEATATVWPRTAAEVERALGGADTLVIGPGLGSSARDLVLAMVASAPQHVTLDADALNAFAGAASAMRPMLDGRAAIITPHVGECARLLGISVGEVLHERFEIGTTLARETGAVVVLKGAPSIVSAPDGRVVVAPVGSPVLATGGSGDVLAGIIGTLAPAMTDPFATALAGVWAHGLAGERVGATHVRGTTLADVIDALRDVWNAAPAPLAPKVLAALPAVGEQ